MCFLASCSCWIQRWGEVYTAQTRLQETVHFLQTLHTPELSMLTIKSYSRACMSRTRRDTGRSRGFDIVWIEFRYVGVKSKAAESAMSTRNCSHAFFVVGTTIFCVKNAESKSSVIMPGILSWESACLKQVHHMLVQANCPRKV